MSPRAFALAMLAFLLTLTALAALYAQPVNSLGQFPVENPIQMTGKDCR